MTRYCIIGAGIAGLSALAQMRAAGHDVDCFEATDRVGGHWNTDYDALHLITSRDQTHFEDFPMPAEYPYFPRRNEVLDYVRAFADAHRLTDHITFNTAVEAVVPLPTSGTSGAGPAGQPGTGPGGEPGVGKASAASGAKAALGSAGWAVTLATGETREYDGVLVANGHLWDPAIPETPGTFTGTQLHSGGYHNTDDLGGPRVLVVGAGNSGCDLAADAAQHRYEVDIVIRHGALFQPKMYFGVPRQQVEWLNNFSPEEQDFITRMMSRLALGEWFNYKGFPEPKAKTLAEGRTVVNDLLFYWIQHGRIAVRPGIERFDGTTVHFTDGSSGDYDSILWCTGFHASLPFIDDALLDRADGVPLRAAAGIVPKGPGASAVPSASAGPGGLENSYLEKLYLVGMSAPRGPQIPVYGMQMHRVLKMIAAHEADPGGCASIGNYLGSLQEPDNVIDIVRDTWNKQLADTDRLLEAFARARLSD